MQNKMIEAADYHGEVIRAAIAGDAAPTFAGGSMSGGGLKGMFSGFGLKKFLFGQEETVGDYNPISDPSQAIVGVADMIPGTGNFFKDYLDQMSLAKEFSENYLAETLEEHLVHSLDLQKAVSWDIQAVV